MSSLLPEGAGIVVGVGVGAAASAAIEPAVEIPKQEAWARNKNRLLAAQLMAALVAQGALELPTGQDSANREGYTSEKFDHLVYLAQTAPGASEALEQWRKGFIDTDLYRHTLVKAARDARYVFTSDAYRLKELVGLGDIAYGIVRGILPAPSWVPIAPPASGDRVPRFPQVDLDPLELAHKLGFNEDMLRLMVGRSGLSMAPVMAATARFRDIIGPNDYLLAIAEGDLRTEWAEAVLETSRQILTSGEYAELQLRGYYDRQTRLENTRKHGMSDQDSDWLYDVQGRGLSLHQAFIAERRGGVFEGPTDQIPSWAMFQLQRGNLRPEVYNLAWAGRESYPSAFVFRALLTDRVLTAEQGETYFLKLGWPAELAHLAAQHYGAGTAAKANPYIGKADTQLWTATHKAYIGGATDRIGAEDRLTLLGIPADVQTEVFVRWDAERSLSIRPLTPSQIRTAWREGATNEATGQMWTFDDALDALLLLRMSPNDAQTFLQLAKP